MLKLADCSSVHIINFEFDCNNGVEKKRCGYFGKRAHWENGENQGREGAAVKRDKRNGQGESRGGDKDSRAGGAAQENKC